MLAASEVKMSRSEKKLNRNTYDISPLKRVTREFLEVSRRSRATEATANKYTKNCAAGVKLFFPNKTY